MSQEPLDEQLLQTLASALEIPKRIYREVRRSLLRDSDDYPPSGRWSPRHRQLRVAYMHLFYFQQTEASCLICRHECRDPDHITARLEFETKTLFLGRKSGKRVVNLSSLLLAIGTIFHDVVCFHGKTLTVHGTQRACLELVQAVSLMMAKSDHPDLQDLYLRLNDAVRECVPAHLETESLN